MSGDPKLQNYCHIEFMSHIILCDEITEQKLKK